MENAVPIVTIERIAVSSFLPKIFDIASPSCAARAVPINLQIKPQGQIGPNRSRPLSCWSLAPAPRFEEAPRLQLKLSSPYPVTGEFLNNIRIHGLGIGYIQFALRDRAIALLGKAAPVQRRRQSRIDLQGGVEIGNGIFCLPALQVDEAAAVES